MLALSRPSSCPVQISTVANWLMGIAQKYAFPPDVSLFGIAQDGKPVLLHLRDPRAGAILVTGSRPATRRIGNSVSAWVFFQKPLPSKTSPNLSVRLARESSSCWWKTTNSSAASRIYSNSFANKVRREWFGRSVQQKSLRMFQLACFGPALQKHQRACFGCASAANISSFPHCADFPQRRCQII